MVGPGRHDPAEAVCMAQSLQHLSAGERSVLEG